MRVQAALCLMLGLVRGLALDAWLVDALAAPQVVLHDDATGRILYSLCNSTGTPVFPLADEAEPEPAASFDLKFPPLNGTGVAGFGYVSEDQVMAQFFYQTEGGAIVDASFPCDPATGRYGPSEKQWVVSTGVGNLPAIRRPSPLAALPVGETAGQRIYFRDADSNRPAVLGYHADRERWQFDGYVLRAGNLSAASGSIGAAILGTQNITLALPLDGDIGIARLGESRWDLSGIPTPIFASPSGDNENPGSAPITNETDPEQWTLSYNETGAFDWSLDAFNSSAAHLGLAFGAEGTLSAFYLGDDGVLRQLNQTDPDRDTWGLAEQQDAERWPVADAGSAAFAIAHDLSNDHIWIYYVSNGRLTEVRQSSRGVWEPAVALPTSSGGGSGNTTSSEPPTTGGSNDGDSGATGGITTGGRIGLGVGLPVGVLLIGAGIWYFRRSRARKGVAELPASTGAISGAAATELWGSAPPPGQGSPFPQEKQGEELVELPLQGERRYEVPDNQLAAELPHDEVHEMPGDTSLRPDSHDIIAKSSVH